MTLFLKVPSPLQLSGYPELVVWIGGFGIRVGFCTGFSWDSFPFQDQITDSAPNQFESRRSGFGHVVKVAEGFALVTLVFEAPNPTPRTSRP